MGKLKGLKMSLTSRGGEENYSNLELVRSGGEVLETVAAGRLVPFPVSTPFSFIEIWNIIMLTPLSKTVISANPISLQMGK